MVFNSIKLFFLIKKINYLYLRLLVKNTQYSLFVLCVCVFFFTN